MCFVSNTFFYKPMPKNTKCHWFSAASFIRCQMTHFIDWNHQAKSSEKRERKKFRTNQKKKLNWKMATEIGANAVRWTHLAVECIFGFVLLCVNSNERLKQFRRHTSVSFLCDLHDIFYSLILSLDLIRHVGDLGARLRCNYYLNVTHIAVAFSLNARI